MPTLTPTPRLPLGDDTFLLVLTGAGVSADSGISTFRAAGGLWNDHKIEDVASVDGFFRDPLLVWQFYGERRRDVAAAVPNAAHRALVAVEERLGDRFLLATQNVDGLHGRAGSRRLIELHGSLLRSRCTVCDRPPFADAGYTPGKVPICGRCHAAGRDALIRPDVVWFGELLPDGALARIERFLDDAAAGRDALIRPDVVWFGELLPDGALARIERFLDDAAAGRLLFLAIGTSGLVFPAAGLVDAVKARGGATWLVNADAAANDDRFDRVLRGGAGELIPALCS